MMVGTVITDDGADSTGAPLHSTDQRYLSKGVNEMKMFMSPAVVQRVLLLDPDSDVARRSTPLASVQRDLDEPLTVDQQAERAPPISIPPKIEKV